MTARTIALIGPMGAGKTSVGRRLAKHLDRRFVDTDAVIAGEHGPIPQLFSTLGEPGFRAIERDVVQRELRSGGVVALGGGAVLDGTTRDGARRLHGRAADGLRGRRRGAARGRQAAAAHRRHRLLARHRGGARPDLPRARRRTVDTSRRPMTRIAAELAEQLHAVGAPQQEEPST